MVKNQPAMQRPGFNPWVGKILWRRKWKPTPVLLPGKFHEWRSLVGYSLWVCKESDTPKELTHIYMNIRTMLSLHILVLFYYVIKRNLYMSIVYGE